MHAFRDGMMGPCIRRGQLYFVVSLIFLSRARKSKHFIMLLAGDKLRISRERPDNFFSVGNPG